MTHQIESRLKASRLRTNSDIFIQPRPRDQQPATSSVARHLSSRKPCRDSTASCSTALRPPAACRFLRRTAALTRTTRSGSSRGKYRYGAHVTDPIFSQRQRERDTERIGHLGVPTPSGRRSRNQNLIAVEDPLYVGLRHSSGERQSKQDARLFRVEVIRADRADTREPVVLRDATRRGAPGLDHDYPV